MAWHSAHALFPARSALVALQMEHSVGEEQLALRMAPSASAHRRASAHRKERSSAGHSVKRILDAAHWRNYSALWGLEAVMVGR